MSSMEENRLRKQFYRLNNEKEFYKTHSFLTKDRRLSLPTDHVVTLPQEERPQVKSCKAKPLELADVKSKLFDYQKTAPRSRRQLMGDDSSPSASPSPHLATHAMEANKMDWKKDIISNLTLNPHAGASVNKGATEIEKSPPQRTRRASFAGYGYEQKQPLIEHHVTSDTQHRRRGSVKEGKAPPIQTHFADDKNDAAKLNALLNRAIQTVQHVEKSSLLEDRSYGHHGKERRGSAAHSQTHVSIDSLKELESILNDAKLYSTRRASKNHSRMDLVANRAQKKRIEHLEQVLKQLNPNYEPTPEIDPMKVLQCSYLRLSKTNIADLEALLKDAGKDPGIHIHTDVTDYDIWKGLKEERTDLVEQRRHSVPVVIKKKKIKQ